MMAAKELKALVDLGTSLGYIGETAALQQQSTEKCDSSMHWTGCRPTINLEQIKVGLMEFEHPMCSKQPQCINCCRCGQQDQSSMSFTEHRLTVTRFSPEGSTLILGGTRMSLMQCGTSGSLCQKPARFVWLFHYNTGLWQTNRHMMTAYTTPE